MVVYVRFQSLKLQDDKKARSWKFYILILIALLVLIPFVLAIFIFLKRNKANIVPLSDFSQLRDSVKDYKGDNKFDFLIFTQLYPITACIATHASKDQCNLAPNAEAWTIHGIWPSLINSQGPQFCTRETFDPKKVDSIRSELDIYWPSITPNKNEYFWKHEWLKHGSCAEQLPAFDNELKYFSQGLAWHKLYNINDALEKAGIVPNNTRTYSVQEILVAVQRYARVIPVLSCVLDKNKQVYLLDEIRLCVAKDEHLESCKDLQKIVECNSDEVIYPEASYITNIN